MKIFIILLPIKYERKLVEHQENMTFNSTIELKQAYPEDSLICDLSDFMDNCNNQEIDLDNYWIGYANLNF